MTENPASHDHATCVKRTIDRADTLARDSGVRMTPTRRRALEILLENHRAMGAYELLKRLDDEGFGSKPVVAYRALNFLQSQGLVHRIEGLNAYVACTHPDHDHRPAFIVCRDCRTVTEANVDLRHGPLAAAAQNAGVTLERTVVEAIGQCENCRMASMSEQDEC